MAEVKKEKELQNKKRILNVVSAIGLILGIAFFVYGFKTGIFLSKEAMVKFLKPFGFWTPIIYVFFITLQAIFMIVPGGFGNLVGVLMFGPWMGILYNYLGNVLGSCLNFYLARRYGASVIKVFSSEEGFEKYKKWLTGDEKKFHKWFAIAIFMPFAPDDLLCYMAGLTNMSFRKFLLIIILGKPAAVAFYSLFLHFGFTELLKFFT